MDQGLKRSFDDMDTSSSSVVHEYVFSPSELLELDNWCYDRPLFGDDDNLDMNTKLVALEASSFTVSLVSFSAETILSQCCGTIIEAEENNNTVITSLNLIRKPTGKHFYEHALAENLKIIVISSDKRSYVAEIQIWDFHYNLLVLKFKSKAYLAPAKLIMVDDDLRIGRSFELRPHIAKAKPEDTLIAVGRYFYHPFDFMAVSGTFSMTRYGGYAEWDVAEYGCRELLTSNCNISRCGDGAPVISQSGGEVVGIVFYDHRKTSPFLPMNIISKWWNYFKTYKELCHPSYGFEARNMYHSKVATIEHVATSFSDVSNGILVDKVIAGSFAEKAGLRDGDVITKCNGESIIGFLKLWELMWDKVGDVVVFEVARVKPVTTLTITMMVGEAVPNDQNRWPCRESKLVDQW